MKTIDLTDKVILNADEYRELHYVMLMAKQLLESEFDSGFWKAKLEESIKEYDKTQDYENN